MMRILTVLVHLGATSCTRIKPGEHWVDAMIGKQYYLVEEHSEGGNLLENAMEKSYTYSEFVEFNLQRLTSEDQEFDVHQIRKEGPDWTGFVIYTIIYQQKFRPVYRLYYTVKLNLDSWEDTELFRKGRFLEDSVLDLFQTQQKTDFDCKIVGINIKTCWPRQLSPYAFCTLEVKFKHPLLTNEKEVDDIDVNKKYTNEYEGEYNGLYVQVNGKGAFVEYDPKPLPTEVPNQISSLDMVGSGGAWSPAAHVFHYAQDVISFIFGGNPADYIATLHKQGKCVDNQACTLEISWGVTNGCTMSNFAIQKSVERANNNLTLLSSSILQDGWALTKISNKAQEAS